MERVERGLMFNLASERINGNRGAERHDFKRKVYDNIHGFIYFKKIIWDFVDTPHFQRLRKIKQLGCLEYVFPGATHSRFEHCLGTAHLAKKFIQILIANHPTLYRDDEKEEAILTVTLAGLLHDVGHGPYSHMFDSNIVTEIEKEGEMQKWTHETASEELFKHMTQLEQLEGHLQPHQIDRIIALIRGDKTGERQWQFQLISNKVNGIDVDKLDYFRRDAFYLGAKNIYIDHDLLMNEARIIDNEICYPTKYAETVYNIFHSRYKLYKNYYHNIISIGVEQMICDILALTQDQFDFKRACEEIFTKPDRYLKLNDTIIERVEDIYENILQKQPIDQAIKEKFEKAIKLINRIRRRKLYKFVKELVYFVKEDEHEKVVQIFEKHLKKDTIMQKIVEIAGIKASDICITINDVGFGLKESNPLKKVAFFRKEEQKLRKIADREKESLSMLVTNAYIERSIKIYIKEDSFDLFEKVDKAFDEFRDNNQKILSLDRGNFGKTPKNARQQNKLIESSSNPFII